MPVFPLTHPSKHLAEGGEYPILIRAASDGQAANWENWADFSSQLRHAVACNRSATYLVWRKFFPML
jgi:hypothetical protein